MSVMLRVSKVSKRFGVVKALDGVSLEVREGDVLGLLGPNGAGKTTLIKISLGLLRRDSGEVLLNNLDPYLDARARIGVGVVFERPSLPDSLRVKDLLYHAARVYGGDINDVRRVLKIARLEGHEWKTFGELSAGLKQRAAIAHALLSNPRFIVADEPTSNLDPVERLRVLELIEELNRDEGVTFLISSHVIPEVTRVASKIVVLNRGRVVASGNPSDIIFKNLVVRIRSSNPELLSSILRSEGYNVRVEGYNVVVNINERSYIELLELIPEISRRGVFVFNIDILGATLESLLSEAGSQ